MIKQFYEKVLPSKGTYCIAEINKEGRVKHHYTESIAKIEPIIEDIKSQRDTNIYVAPGSFNKTRLAKNSLYFKCIFIDVDVGDKKDYKTKEEAGEALDKFIEESELPKPIRVDSGNGYHAYWCLDRDITKEEYLIYSKKLADYCNEKGLKNDPAVMKDTARIMRCPDTHNYKSDPPKHCIVMDEDIGAYTIEEIQAVLGEVQPSLEDILNQAKSPLTEEERKALKLDNFQSSFEKIVKETIKGNGCGQIMHILQNASTLQEPMWYAGLSIAQHCKDKEKAIHLISSEHPGYNAEETERKAMQSQDKPFSCDKFNDLNPGICEGCQHYKKITNPLAIGKEFIAAPVPENYVLGNTAVVAKSGYPKDLYPYVRGASGGVYFEFEQEYDDDGQPLPRKKPLMVLPYDFEPIKRIYSPVDGECLEMQLELPHDGTRQFLVPIKSLYAVDKFRDIITSQGILYNPNNQQGKHLMTYIYKWGDYLVSRTRADIMRMQMGWTVDKDAFIIGNKEINRKGEILNSPTSPLCKSIAVHLKEQGEYDKWKEAANKLNYPSLELHAFTMLTAFGSVLLSETSTNGMTISLTGSDSGTGKTGSLHAALSVWGDPRQLGINTTEGSTNNALVGRYLGLHNITFGYDEVGNIDSRTLSNLILKISSGKAKIRMQASVNAERDHEMSASLIAVFTSNHSLYDRLTTFKKNPNGEVARLIEFTVRKPKILIEKPELGFEIFNSFAHHHGHAGIDFIQNLFKYTKEEIVAKLNKWTKKFKEDFGDDTTYRFYENMISAVFTGGEIACEAGIVDLNLDRIYNQVIHEIINIRDNVVRINDVDYESMLGEYINSHQTGILAIEENNRISMEPRSDLVMRAELDKSLLWIEKRHFREYLAESGISINDFVFKMKEKGYNIRDHKRRMGTGWKAATGFSAVMALEIDTTKFLEDLLKENNNEAA